MRRPTPEETDAWLNAARSAAPHIDEIHRWMHERTSAVAPVCTASGRCCDFGRFGHDLFTTGLEAAVCLTRLPNDVGLERGVLDEAISRGGCPFQIGKLCGVHPVRPSGCRAFFCDPSREQELFSIAEEAQRRVRAVHDELGLPYLYSEWRRLLVGFVDAGFSRPVRANPPERVMLRVACEPAHGA